ncbi:MAG: tetratricopeptide repeat protein [Saprospiraceae bacterium]|nr:tetratricopeptide repeat protein [Saprospiraceae bacterium]
MKHLTTPMLLLLGVSLLFPKIGYSQQAELDAYYEKAAAFQDNGQWDEAAQVYNLLLDFNPMMDKARFNRGYCHLQSGRYVSAKADFEQVLLKNQYDFEALEMHGLACFYNGEFGNAIQDFSAILEKQDNPNVYLYRARTYLRIGDADAAFFDIQNCLEFGGSQTGEIAWIYGEIMMARKQYPMAIDQFLTAGRSGIKNPYMDYNLGLAYYQVGQIDKSISHLEASNQVLPTSASFAQLALAKIKKGELEEAKSLAVKAVGMDWQNPTAYYANGMACLHLNQYEQAVEKLNKAVVMEPENAEFYYQRAVANARLGNRISAQLDCQKALVIDPNKTEASNLYASIGK